MQANAEISEPFDWRDLADDGGYQEWRAQKLLAAETALVAAPVQIDSFAAPSSEAVREIKKRCASSNFAVYEYSEDLMAIDEASRKIAAFGEALGLQAMEDHRSAGTAGVVALRQTEEAGKRGYIPYTPRALNWHTDGYYNSADKQVRSFLLHCVNPSLHGGENQIVDPEVAYLRLRDADSRFVAALVHPEAMTIPENREANGKVRPASTGPVFMADPVSGRLQMRYTARTRSIAWRDDPVTLEAADWLRTWLTSGEPLMHEMRLKRGQGIMNNNVLHNRTSFEDGDTQDEKRVILRVRYQNRLSED